MSTKTEPRSAIVLRRHQAHLNRYAGDGGSPMEFGDEWEKEDYTEELSDASWLLFDVLSSIWYNYDSYASWDAMLQAMAKAMNEYLAAVAAIPQEVDKDQAVVAARSMVTRMALGCSVPLAVISRAGKKYSTETAAKLKAAHEKMEAAYNEMCAIMADVDGAAGDNGGEVAPPENSGDGKQKDGAPAGTQPAEGDKDKQLQAAAPAVAAVAASAASTGTAPAVAATSTAAPAPAAAPAPTEAQRALDDAKRDLADVNKRLAAIDGAPAPAAPTVAAPPVEDPVLVEAKRVRAEVEAAKNKIEEIEKRRAGSAQVASSGNASAPAPATATSETKRTWDGGIVFGPTSVRPKDNG